MKVGVSTTPCRVVNLPRRAQDPGDVLSNSNETGTTAASPVGGIDAIMNSIVRAWKRGRQSASAPTYVLDRARTRLCAMAFATLYGPGARRYDRFTTWLFAGEWRRWQETIVPLFPDHGTVVELGSGTADLARRYATWDRRWVAVERSPAMLSVARRAATGTPVRLVRADAGALPLADHTADLIIATFPAAFIVEPATWREIERVLQLNGRYAIVATGRLHPTDASTRWRRILLAAAYGMGGGAEPPRLPGVPPDRLPGAWQWIPTTQGEALVLIGRRLTCAPPEAPDHAGVPG
jgi:hypothetical protein